MIQQNLHLFKSIKQCFFTYLIFLFCSIGYILSDCILQYISMGSCMDILGVLQDTLSITLYTFIIFMYITYEYLAHAKRCFAEECLCTMQISKSTQEIMQLMVCVCLGLIYIICMCGINIFFCFLLHADSSEYIFYMINVLFVYSFLPIVIGILVGGIFSYIQNSLFSYSFLVLLTLYFSIRFYQFFYNSETLFGLSDFSQIFCVSANYSIQYGFLFPLELHFIIKPFYTIGMLLVILLSVFYYRIKDKKIIIGQAGIIICVIVCVVLWEKPCSGCYYGYEDQELLLYQDMDEDKEASLADDFYVEQYNMELNLQDGFSAKVRMFLSERDCPEYVFTFCGRYKIDSLKDAQGNNVTYQRNGNYLIVKNEGNKLNEISICYTGKWLNRYFAGKRGIYLPGNFPFYPIAGKHPVYAQGLCELPSQESEFYVAIKYDNTIYSNLEMDDAHVWKGKSNNLTLVSGFWKEKDIQGIDIIYPYVSVNYNPEMNNYLMSGILEYYKKDIHDGMQDYHLKGKKIVIAPFGYEGGSYMFGSDTVVIGSKSDLDYYYLNYIMTGQWHINDDLSDDEIQKILEDNPL